MPKGTVKPMYKDHTRNPKILAVVDRWSLIRGHLCFVSSRRDPEMMVAIGGGYLLRLHCTCNLDKSF